MSEDKKDWTQYGLLRSPMEEMGFDEVIYKSGRKTELYINTNKYVTARNTLLGELSKGIDTSFAEIMENAKLKNAGVPLQERKRIAFEVAKQKKQSILNIVEEIFPMADSAYKQASNITSAQNVVDGNLIGSVSAKPNKKKGGRPKGSVNKKKSTKKTKK